MTRYVGTTVQVATAVFDTDAKTPLTPDDGVIATITIFDTDKTTVLIDEATMAWDATVKVTVTLPSNQQVTVNGGWVYLWNTTGRAPGSYRARVTGAGMGIEEFAFPTIRLRQPPVG